MNQARGVQGERVGAGLCQYAIQRQRAGAAQRAGGPLQVAVDDDRTAGCDIQRAAAQQHICRDRRAIAQRGGAAILLHASVTGKTGVAVQRARAAAQQQQRAGSDLLRTCESTDRIVGERALVDQQGAGLLHDEVAVVA